MAKVLYDFAGQKENELSIRAGDVIEIVQKENNGKTATQRLGNHLVRCANMSH